jgi:germacradienol/geosmin synthase
MLSRAGAGLLGPVKPFATPNLHMPFASRANPRVDAVRRHALAWATEMGLLAGDVWTEERFHAMDFGLFSALTYPDAEQTELELVNDWHVLGWYLEDLFAEKSGRTLDPPAERALADLHERASGNLADQLSMVADRRLSDVADPIDLIESRRSDGTLAAAFVRYVLGNNLPETEPMRALVDAFADVVTLNSDAISYPRQIDTAKATTNTVLAVQRFLDCSQAEAVKVISDLSASRLRRFEHIAANELPSEDLDQRLLSYVDSLRDWLAGHLQWHQLSGRYLRQRVRIPAMRGGPRDRIIG